MKSTRSVLSGPAAAALFRVHRVSKGRRAWTEKNASRSLAKATTPAIELRAESDRRSSAIAAKPAPWQASTPLYPSMRAVTWVRQGYLRNAVMRRVVDMRADALTAARFRVIRRSTREEVSHPSVELLRRPTNTLGENERWRMLELDLALTGNAFWEKERDANGKVIAYWRMLPMRTAIQLDTAESRIENFLYDVGDGQWRPIPFADVLHWRYPNPDIDGWFGVPPILSAASHLASSNELDDQFNITLRNRAVPAVVIETDPPGDRLMPWNATAAAEARQAWRERTSGKHLGDVAIMPPHQSVRVIGMSWAEMDMANVGAVPASSICMVYGVPHQLILPRSGAQGDATRSNMAEARETFWSTTMSPHLAAIAEVPTTCLLPEWPRWRDLMVDFDISSVPVLAAARLARLKTAGEIFKTGLASRHVLLAAAGEELHGPDVLYRPTAVDQAIPRDATEEDVEDTGDDVIDAPDDEEPSGDDETGDSVSLPTEED